jgi:hypothetical protein
MATQPIPGLAIIFNDTPGPCRFLGVQIDGKNVDIKQSLISDGLWAIVLGSEYAAVPEMKAACEATHKYYLAVTAQSEASGNDETVEGIGLPQLCNRSSMLVFAAIEKLQGKLGIVMEGQDDVDAQVELRKVNGFLLRMLKAATEVLRSYQRGNDDKSFAQRMADNCDKAIEGVARLCDEGGSVDETVA